MNSERTLCPPRRWAVCRCTCAYCPRVLSHLPQQLGEVQQHQRRQRGDAAAVGADSGIGPAHVLHLPASMELWVGLKAQLVHQLQDVFLGAEIQKGRGWGMGGEVKSLMTDLFIMFPDLVSSNFQLIHNRNCVYEFRKMGLSAS